MLRDRVSARRGNFEYYRKAFAATDGISFMPEASFGTATRWLTVVLVDPRRFGADREAIRAHLESRNIEARPLWKPLHLQPLFQGCRVVGGAVAEDLFREGLCLPSGSQMEEGDLARVVDAVFETPRRA